MIEGGSDAKQPVALPLQLVDALTNDHSWVSDKSFGSFCSAKVSNGAWSDCFVATAEDLIAEIVYEQDWLDYEFMNMYYMLESATAGSTWINQVLEGSFDSLNSCA